MEKLNLEQNSGDYTIHVPGVKFYHRGTKYDLREITPAKADMLAADHKCKFLSKKGIEKVDPNAPKETTKTTQPEKPATGKGK